MKTLTINHLAVIVTASAQQLVGAAWYGIFRNLWMQLILKQAADFEGQSLFPYAVSFVGALISCYVTAWLFTKLNIDNALHGIAVAALLWLGFTFFPIAQIDLFSLRSIELSFINAGNVFADAVLCGAMLGAWRKYES